MQNVIKHNDNKPVCVCCAVMCCAYDSAAGFYEVRECKHSVLGMCQWMTCVVTAQLHQHRHCIILHLSMNLWRIGFNTFGAVLECSNVARVRLPPTKNFRR